MVHFVAESIEPGSGNKGIVPESSWFIYSDEAWGSVGARAAAVLI
jgi:hypothetical protein